MNPRATGHRIATVALLAASAFLLSGCGVVAQMISDHPVMNGGERAIARCGLLAVEPDALDGTVAVLQQRLADLAMPEATVVALPPDRIALALPTGDDGSWQDALTRTGILAFVPVPDAFAADVVDGAPLPAAMDPTPLLTQEAIVEASIAADEGYGPTLHLRFSPEAAATFDAWAADHVGQRFAIVVDGVVLTAPVIRQGAFNGEAQISGSFTEPQLRGLLVALGSGPLPAPVVTSTWDDAQEGTCPHP